MWGKRAGHGIDDPSFLQPDPADVRDRRLTAVERTTGEITAVQVTVRYFAGARAAAGTGEEVLTMPAGGTVQDLSDALSARHGAGMARVLAACSFLANEIAADRGRVLGAGVQVDVLPPFAGVVVNR